MTHYHAPPKVRSLLSPLGWIYVGGMLAWFGLRLVLFDGLWWLALLNTLAFYLFLPLVVAATQQRYAQRAAEVAYLDHSIRARTMPTLILCDCNMTDTSETYARLHAVIGDSFQERGWGLGYTLRVAALPLPVQRVDYIWHTNELSTVDAAIGPDGGSDHFPIVTTLQWISSPL